MGDGLWAIGAGVVLWLLTRVPAFSPDARRVARAKRDADLVAVMPLGPLKGRMEFEVNEQVTLLLERREAWRLGTERFATQVVIGAVSLFLISVGLARLTSGDSDDGMATIATAVLGASLLIACVVGVVRAAPKLALYRLEWRKRRDAFLVERADHPSA